MEQVGDRPAPPPEVEVLRRKAAQHPHEPAEQPLELLVPLDPAEAAPESEGVLLRPLRLLHLWESLKGSSPLLHLLVILRRECR